MSSYKVAEKGLYKVGKFGAIVISGKEIFENPGKRFFFMTVIS